MARPPKPYYSTFKVPPTLSHFTTVAGLKGICESRSLWASNVTFLNDRRELVHGIEASRRAILQFLNSTEGVGDYEEYLREAVNTLTDSGVPDTYATCFCKASDLLSRWRGYSGRVQGVSLTFDGRALRRMFGEADALPIEVIYDDERAAQRLLKSVHSTLELYEDGMYAVDPTTRNRFVESLARLVPRFKDSGFAEEREWRFVLQTRSGKLPNVHFHERDGVLVPYVIISSGDAPLPLVKVTVGPGKDQELTRRSIERFLRHAGYFETEVVPSNVPYRQ